MKDIAADRLMDVVDSLLVWPDAVLTPVHDLVMEVALDHGLNAFDAAYLALALERGDAIATMDKQLQRAAQACELVVWS